MKITSCGGQDVTYMGKIDMKIAFQVLWNEKKKAIEVSIKPVDTELSDVNVVGCKPPWYLWWVVVEIENIKFPFKSQLISPSPSLPPSLPSSQLRSNLMAIKTQRKIKYAPTYFSCRREVYPKSKYMYIITPLGCELFLSASTILHS